jgi:hypothetical protein
MCTLTCSHHVQSYVLLMCNHVHSNVTLTCSHVQFNVQFHPCTCALCSKHRYTAAPRTPTSPRIMEDFLRSLCSSFSVKFFSFCFSLHTQMEVIDWYERKQFVLKAFSWHTCGLHSPKQEQCFVSYILSTIKGHRGNSCVKGP